MKDYSALSKTGLSFRELGTVMGVAHMTISNLMKNKTKEVQPRIAAQVDPATDVLLQLVELGKLPMKTVERERRAENVQKIRAYIAKKLNTEVAYS